jgi:uncharacterized membrane protein
VADATAQAPVSLECHRRDVTRANDLAAAVRNGFVTGLVVIAPLVVTLVVLRVVYGWLVGLIQPILGLWVTDVGTVENLLGLVGVFVLLTLIGLALRLGAGDTLVVEFDRVMERIPVIRTVYSPTREASTALLEHGDQFERVALVEWPRTGLRTVGFVTDDTSAEIQSALDAEEPHYDVFIPMSPNPMGGFLAFVPDSQLTMTDLSVQEGLQLVVTTGMSGEDELQL